jgi:hypothetical protein
MPFTCGDYQKKAKPLDFQELECLRLFSRQIQLDQLASLAYFAYGVGYQHVPGNNRISVSSSATCVLSLVASGSWAASKHTRQNTKELLQDLLSRDSSADLPPDNPFTTAWILEAVTWLKDFSDPLDPADDERVDHKEKVLQEEIEKG